MNKIVLITIKVAITMFVGALVGLSKTLGLPIAIGNVIGIGVIFAVWRYKPETSDKVDKNGLNKR